MTVSPNQLRAAISRARENKGGIIELVANETYSLVTPLVLDDIPDLTLIGSHTKIVIPIPLVGQTSCIMVDNPIGLTIEGITFTGRGNVSADPHTGAHGIWLTGEGRNVNIRNCSGVNLTTFARFGDGALGGTIRGVSIVGCSATSCQTGLGCLHSPSGIVVDGFTALNCGRTAFLAGIPDTYVRATVLYGANFRGLGHDIIVSPSGRDMDRIHLDVVVKGDNGQRNRTIVGFHHKRKNTDPPTSINDAWCSVRFENQPGPFWNAIDCLSFDEQSKQRTEAKDKWGVTLGGVLPRGMAAVGYGDLDAASRPQVIRRDVVR